MGDAEEGEDIYSDEFKDLFEKMMALNPAHRPKLEEVLAHPWMQGSYATEDEIQVEFKRRKAIVDEEAHNERENKRKQRDADNKTRVRRGAEKVFKFYAEKINGLPADIQTAAQKAILEKPETKAILEGKKEIEESKDEAKATCIIELLGVKNIEKAEGDEESKETEE